LETGRFQRWLRLHGSSLPEPSHEREEFHTTIRG
jgi:hypothetical protein